MKCPKCGEELEDGAAFCTNCGEKLASAPVCPHCGAELREGDGFCGKCGKPVAKEEKTSVCPNCGAELEPDEKFCSQCDTAVTTEYVAMDQAESSQVQSNQQMATDINADSYEDEEDDDSDSSGDYEEYDSDEDENVDDYEEEDDGEHGSNLCNDEIEENPFIMQIEDIFALTGRGTAVTGRIKSGVIHVNDAVEIIGENSRLQTVVTCIEMCNKKLSVASCSRYGVGLILNDIKKADIERGWFVVKPGLTYQAAALS